MSEQALAPVHSGGCPAGKQIHRKHFGGFLADTKLTIGQQSAPVVRKPTKGTLGCVRSSAAGRETEATLPLYSALVTPRLGAGPVLGSPDTRDMDILERV